MSNLAFNKGNIVCFDDNKELTCAVEQVGKIIGISYENKELLVEVNDMCIASVPFFDVRTVNGNLIQVTRGVDK